jgi:hypothetical protein
MMDNTYINAYYWYVLFIGIMKIMCDGYCFSHNMMKIIIYVFWFYCKIFVSLLIYDGIFLLSTRSL